MTKAHKVARRLLYTVSLLAAAALLAGTLSLNTLNRVPSSTAYLYDEDRVTANYTVEQLAFDLSSDHMYSYNNESLSYTGTMTTMLGNLSTLVANIESSGMELENFDTQVKTALAMYYDPAMIEDLQEAWDDADGDQATYNENTRRVYNTYNTRYEFLFKIRSLQIASVEDTRSIWYYYAKDLLETYQRSYVVQTKATGVRQSTIKIGVKLKGGTTFSADTGNRYYDTEFNQMVTPFTLRFQNTGNVLLFLNLSVQLSLGDNGVLGLVMPYGYTWESMRTEYADCYDANTDTWDYRALLANIMGGTTLNYAECKAALTAWNATAIASYRDNEMLNSQNNFAVASAGDTLTATTVGEVQIPMLFWADYEACAATFAADVAGTENEGASWVSDAPYDVMTCPFVINMLTTLKNNDMTDLADDESVWEALFNEKKVVDKFAAVSNFEVEGFAYFEQTIGNVTTAYDAKGYMEGGYIRCSYEDPTAANYLLNLRFSVRYFGFSPAYIRVRLVEQVTNPAGEIEAVNQMKFRLGETFWDNRADDLYFYSPKLFTSTDLNSVTAAGEEKARMRTIPVITGLADGVTAPTDIDELFRKTGLTVKLIFMVEAVQPNRVEAYWGRSVDQLTQTVVTP